MARTKQVARDSASGKQKKHAKDTKHKRVLKYLEKDAKSAVKKTPLKSAGGIKKPHKWKPGTVAKREVNKYQSGRSKHGTRLLLPKAVIDRKIRRIVSKYTRDVRLQEKTVLGVQASLEGLLVEILSKTGMLTVLRRRKTISANDFIIATEFFLKDYLVDKHLKRTQEAMAEEAGEKQATD
jgi:histone H3